MRRTSLVLAVLVTVALAANPTGARSSPKGTNPSESKPKPQSKPAKSSASPDTGDGSLRQISVFGGESSAPWRGSQVALRTMTSAISLDRSADQTYNPYVAMSWSFRPWWWFSERLYASAQLDIVSELTESDTTTYAGETRVQDLRLVIGGSGLYTIPKAKILVSANLVLTLPTSKVSEARTLVLGIGPGTRLSRRFDVLGGLVVGYNLRVNPWLHSYSTAERQTPLVPGCGSEPGGCGAYLHTGRRNPVLRLTQSADASIRLTDWMGASLAVGHAIDWLHSIGDAPAEVSLGAGDDQDRRYLTFFELELSFQPIDLLEIAAGLSSVHPQLAPDSSHYVPFFNRYSVLFVDLRLHVEDAVARIQRIVQ